MNTNELETITAYLDQQKALADAATPGPWFYHNPDDYMAMNVVCVTASPNEPDTECCDVDGSFAKDIIAMTLFQSPRVVDHESAKWDENAVFIASSRSSIPALERALRIAVAALAVESIETESDHENQEDGPTSGTIRATEAIEAIAAMLRKNQ